MPACRRRHADRDRHHVSKAQQLGQTVGGNVKFPCVLEVALLGAVLAFEQGLIDIDELDVSGVGVAAVRESGLLRFGDTLPRVGFIRDAGRQEKLFLFPGCPGSRMSGAADQHGSGATGQDEAHSHRPRGMHPHANALNITLPATRCPGPGETASGRHIRSTREARVGACDLPCPCAK